jgi:hypothetical protein
MPGATELDRNNHSRQARSHAPPGRSVTIFEKSYSVAARRLRIGVDAFDMSDEASRFGTVDMYIARRRITEDAVDGLFDFI